MAATRIALTLVIMVGVATPAAARPKCRLDTVNIPTCAGTGAAANATFCFGDACEQTGSVLGVRAPDAPFVIAGFHVDGPLGSRPVDASAFPLLLASGEQLVADLQVVLGAPGEASSQITWFANGASLRQHDDDGDGSCTTALVATAPSCEDVTPAHPCTAETCAGGACVPVAVTGPCDAPCSTGGTCTDGVCVGGLPLDCADAFPCTLDSCDPTRGCVHTPAETLCDDGDPCTADSCDPTRGCVHGPATGAACDDGDACTTDDRCRAGGCRGDPVRCADAFACTEDRCIDGRCQFVPSDARCDGGACARATCSPDDPGADSSGCLRQPVNEGEPCTDDGRSCTDDVCTGGVCLHVPVDTRCGVSGQCSATACQPERAQADEAGCVAGPAPADGGLCAEDGDPCSDDICRGNSCLHQPVPEWPTCMPVQGAFRKALGLMALTRGLQAAVIAAPAAARSGPADGLLTPLARVESDMQVTTAVLAGRDGGEVVVARADETPAQARARVAFGELTRTPASVRAFCTVVRAKPAKAMLGTDGWRAVRRRGMVLLRGTKSLKGELRRLQQVSRTFAR